METIKNKLREIAEKTANRVTNEDKEFVKTLALQYGVDLSNTNTRCKSCWVDAAIAVYKAMKDAEPIPAGRKYVLRDGVDVYWKGVRINEASCTDEAAEMWIKNGFPKIYFK